MADNHGNTPAAWTACGVAMLGFLVGSIALLLSPVNMVMLWIGIALAVVALPIFMVMARMGLNGDGHGVRGEHERAHDHVLGRSH